MWVPFQANNPVPIFVPANGGNNAVKGSRVDQTIVGIWAASEGFFKCPWISADATDCRLRDSNSGEKH